MALVLACSGCGDALPSSADLPELLSEAADAAAAEAPPAADGSAARDKVRDALRHVLDLDRTYSTELGRLFRGPHLQSYLFLDDSFVGGSFPLQIAAKLRESQRLETEYLQALGDFPQVLASRIAEADLPRERRSALVAELAGAFQAQREPIETVLRAHREFVREAAELYELMGAQPQSIRSMREGLEIADPHLLEQFNTQVDEVNLARDRVEAALGQLDAGQQLVVHWMGLVKRIQRP